MRARLCALAVAQIMLGGAASAQSLPPRRLLVSDQRFAKYDSLRPDLSLPDSAAPTRMHRAKVGAIAGAVSLGILGFLAASQAETGCDLGDSNCRSDSRKLGLIAYGTALGATAGAITGGVVGFAWPLPRTVRKR